MSPAPYPRVASLKSAEAFRAHLDRSGIPIAFDDELAPAGESPLGEVLDLPRVRVGNRFCILPMEGWDGTRDGEPSDLTRRRWRNFGISGAKLMWGGEAVAVRRDGRANPHQLLMNARTQPAIAALREELVAAHRDRFGPNADGDLYVGLQLTHSGRYARPEVYDRPAPIAACPNPILDRRFPGGVRVFEDEELDRLVDDFVAAARLARDAGFSFVDVKACHGYLGHELLGARTGADPTAAPSRTARASCGGSSTRSAPMSPGSRSRSASRSSTRPRTASARPIRSASPSPCPPPRPAALGAVHGSGAGFPRSAQLLPGFGLLHSDADMDAALDDARAVLRLLESMGVAWICVTAGSPYYNPHVQRPAIFPPLDGYEPPEDPLRGVWRQIEATAMLKRDFPNLVFVGSAYSYLQEWLPHVGQHNVREGLCDFVGLGRIALSYPGLPADVLSGAPLKRALFCRTFSDCTTGPRMGLVSGCYPLDTFYAARPEAIQVRNGRIR